MTKRVIIETGIRALIQVSSECENLNKMLKEGYRIEKFNPIKEDRSENWNVEVVLSEPPIGLPFYIG